MVRIRTKREVDLIATSCQIVADTLNMLTKYVKPGTSILDLDSKAVTGQSQEVRIFRNSNSSSDDHGIRNRYSHYDQ